MRLDAIVRLLLTVSFVAHVRCFAGPVVTPFMERTRPGAVRPEGWLLDMARKARDGYTGHMDAVDVQFSRSWRNETRPRGKDLLWVSDPGAWSCEGGAYWFDGLVKLAYQLDDPLLKALASNRLDTVLSEMNPHAIGFCWWLDRNDPKQVLEMKISDAWLIWVTGMFARPVCAWHEVSGDARALKALDFALDEHAFSYGKFPTLPSGAYAGYQVTRSERIARALDEFWKKALHQPGQLPAVFSQYLTPPPAHLEETLNIRRLHERLLKIPTRHGVIASEALLSIFDGYLWTGNTNLLNAVRGWYAFFDRHMRQPYGVTTMDEEWGHPGPERGTETCVVAAEGWTRINLLAALGEGCWGDDVERNFFNAGRNCMTEDYRRHVYLQQPNRLTASDVTRCSFTGARGDRLARYDTKHWPLCCTAALNRILPNYVASMWMLPADGGVAATLYGPCRFAAELSSGSFEVEEHTDYPYSDTITFKIVKSPNAAFPFHVRFPGWCANPELQVNGRQTVIAAQNGFAAITRIWRAGDVVTLRLPMKPTVEKMFNYNEPRGREYASVSVGPILYALPISSKDDNNPEGDVHVPSVSAGFDAASVRVGDAMRMLTIPDSKGNSLKLVPYGDAKLRISMFPVDGD